MRRYNAGGRLEDSYLKRLVERAREDSVAKRELDIKELFDFSIARSGRGAEAGAMDSVIGEHAMKLNKQN